MKRFGLIGYPLSHSFSRKFFTDKFEREGLKDCVYELFPLKSIDQLPGLLKKHTDLRGLNVTIPYKQDVIKYLHRSMLPGKISACNCIRVTEGSLEGYNTDITGFEKSFIPGLKTYHNKALVLGNGGATAAVTFVLQLHNIPYSIVSRQLRGGSVYTYSDLNEKIIREHRIIINTTPLGTFPDVSVYPPIPYDFIKEKHYLFDLVYNPSETMFLKKGAERGATVRNGYEMLEIQAEESWKIWNNE